MPKKEILHPWKVELFVLCCYICAIMLVLYSKFEVTNMYMELHIRIHLQVFIFGPVAHSAKSRNVLTQKFPLS